MTTEEIAGLSRCPFCDGAAFIEGHPFARMVTCDRCEASTGQFEGDAAAAAAWNRRASHPPAESAGSPSTSGVGVTIKPLEWKKYRSDVSEATTPFGDYQIAYYEEHGDGAGWLAIFNDSDEVGAFPTDLIAATACQTHYEARIRSALSAAPTQDGGNG